MESSDGIYKFRLNRLTEEKPRPGSPLPKARSGHRIVHYNGRIFSFGGYNPMVEGDDPDIEPAPILFKELWEFNLATKLWNKIRIQGAIPEQLASHTAILHPALRGEMVIYGGTGFPFGTITSTDLVSCNLETGIFKKILQKLPPKGILEKLYGQATALDDQGWFYTVGGTSGFQYFMDVNGIDLTSAEPVWEQLNSREDGETPYPRYRHEICVYQRKIFVLGGGTNLSVCGFQDLPTFNLDGGVWSKTRTLPDSNTTIDMGDGDGYPDSRRCHGAVQLQNMVYIIGGYDGEYVCDMVWRLNLDTYQWKRMLIELPTPVYFHAVTITEEGKLLMFGGVEHITENRRNNKVFSAWLNLPSLRSMCWEALSTYIPNLPDVDRDTLRQIGVPGDCIDTIRTSSELAACG